MLYLHIYAHMHISVHNADDTDDSISLTSVLGVEATSAGTGTFFVDPLSCPNVSSKNPSSLSSEHLDTRFG